MKYLCSVHSAIKRCADGENCDVFTLALDVGVADSDFIRCFGNAALMELLADVVNSLAFKEDDGVCAVEGFCHKSFCVIRRCGEYDLQSRNVSAESCPVLAVLCAVLVTDRNTEDNGHLENSRTHRLPFGELVEYFVAGAADKVGIHKFDYRASACHCVTDGRADDCRLGNRSVEEAVIRNCLGQTSVNGECAAPVTVVFAIGNESRILIEFVEDRLKETVAETVDLHLRKSLAVSVKRPAGFDLE